MAGLRTVAVDALPGLADAAVAVPLAVVAAVLVTSLLVGVVLSRAGCDVPEGAGDSSG